MLTRNMDLNDIVSESIQFFAQNFLLVAGIVVLAGLPLFIWQVFAVLKPNEWVTPLHYRSARDLGDVLNLVSSVAGGRWNSRLIASLGVSAFASLIQAGALVHAVSERAGTRTVTPLQCIFAAYSRLGALVTGNGLIFIIVVMAALAVGKLPPGISTLAVFALVMLALYPRWLLVTPAIMAGRLDGLWGMRRAIEVTGGRYWFVLSVWLVTELVLVVAALIPMFVLGLISVSDLPTQTRQLANLIIPGLGAIVIDPAWHIMAVLLYFQVHRRWARTLT